MAGTFYPFDRDVVKMSRLIGTFYRMSRFTRAEENRDIYDHFRDMPNRDLSGFSGTSDLEGVPPKRGPNFLQIRSGNVPNPLFLWDFELLGTDWLICR